jgi:uncharacterized protein
MSQHSNPLRLNVGFIVNIPLGESRSFPVEISQIALDPELDAHNLTGNARFTRTANGILAQVKMMATLKTQCVRCLTDFDLSLNIDFTELFAFSKNSTTDSELLFPEDGYINLVPLVREYLLIGLPISPLCKPECKGLCPVCGENLNETTCNHEESSVDPRLSILKTLLKP